MSEMPDHELDELIDRIGLQRPARGPGARAQCGTPSGYRRHRNDGEMPCDPCREANSEKQRAHYQNSTVRPDLPHIAHGTVRGARQHWYRKVPICQPCKDAYNLHQNARKAARSAGEVSSE